MRAKEFLLEYNRQKTADSVGPALIMALANDRSVTLPNFLSTLRRKLQGIGRMDMEKLSGVIPPEKQKDTINAILAGIEDRDPTPNREYTPWLARMYAKSGGGLPIEDMNRGDLLGAFHTAKKRRIIKPEHADINRFKYYQDFEDAMEHHYNNFEDLDADQRPDGKATKVYDDETVTIVVPEDEAAACKYGRGTRWCTASTRGMNYFNQYNRQGKLYILIPKKPKYEGEKYQLHFSSNSYMDENDDPVPLSDILNRFPGTKEFFFSIEPSLKEKINFVSDEELQQAIESVAELAQEKIWEAVSDWEMQDDGYYQFLRDEGLVDEEDGDIDWDKVDQAGLNYSEYNPEVERWSKDIYNVVTPSPQELKDMIEDDPYEFGNYDTVKSLPDILGIRLREKYRGNRNEGDNNIGQWLREKVDMIKNGNKWEAYIVPSLRLPQQ